TAPTAGECYLSGKQSSQHIIDAQSKRIEELQKQVAMLSVLLQKYSKYGAVGSRDIDVAEVQKTLANTQATAEAFMREYDLKMLEEFERNGNENYLRNRIAQLRTANKK
ncbi:MAG TPA: hypothetical protein VFM18_14650, partial [Methanosarcina sp.]|nr:hypothetical protein [Methanosarcina sp.]